MERTVGTATVYCNGRTFYTRPGAKLTFGTPNRTPLVGDGRIATYSEMPTAATVTCEFTATSSTDIVEIGNLVGATVVYSSDIGAKWVLRDAVSQKSPELTAGEGAVAVEFFAETATRVN